MSVRLTDHFKFLLLLWRPVKPRHILLHGVVEHAVGDREDESGRFVVRLAEIRHQSEWSQTLQKNDRALMVLRRANHKASSSSQKFFSFSLSSPLIVLLPIPPQEAAVKLNLGVSHHTSYRENTFELLRSTYSFTAACVYVHIAVHEHATYKCMLCVDAT